ncbi:TIGR03759 family integrating conjugative element protein [Pseudomonas sp. NA-150]|uniref:TIGR03759 family integrating conjugative element protein n=1 Tax=Pseudomonas sp. NA-150 TaxID=3367525 RepID=UPI0037C8A9F0
MRSLIFKAMFLAGIITAASTAMATTERLISQNTQIENSSIDALATQKASQWGLDTAEWEHFQQLMQGPLGIHSPNLDPLTALGIEAKTEQERTRYAELQVHMETARVTKLLAYQNAYDEAYKRLYPQMLPVNLVGTDLTPQASPVSAPDRLAVFVTADCKTCADKVKQLQRDNQRFDVYLVGSRGSDDSIRAWALTAGISPDKVHSRQITLNHDSGRWTRVGGKGEFPAVLREIGGKWVRQ